MHLAVKEKVYDFTQPLRDGMPRMPFMPEPSFEVVQEIDERRCKISQLHVCTHLGTHVDAPAHYVIGGKAISDYPLERFFAPAVICHVDVEPLGAITTQDIAHRDIRAGDAVLFSTGWGEKAYGSDYSRHPYLDEKLAEWLVERRVSFVGVDFFTPEKPMELREPGWNAPVHRRLLSNDVLIIENLRGMSSLDGKRVRMIAAPILVESSVEAAPARIFAFADDE